jgi:Ni/Fe-hydrogenase subunit HybB-like protein
MVGQMIVLSYLPNEIVVRYTTYFPSLIEIFVRTGVVSYGLLAFTIGVRYMNIIDHDVQHEEQHMLGEEFLPYDAPAAD